MAAKGFRAKVKIFWTGVKEAATDLAGRMADFFWRGWSEGSADAETRRGSAQVAAKFHAGLLAGLATLDWGSIGQQILSGVVAGIRDVGELGKKVAGVIDSAMGQIPWDEVGVKLGPGLAAMVAQAFVTLMDPGFWAAHWELALSIAIA